jgi:hypothetical protein
MNLKHAFAALLLSAFSIGGAQAAGSPMNEDYTQLAAATQKAVATGKTGTVEAFAADAEVAFKIAKEKLTTLTSPSMQRITSKIKTGMNEAKAGKVAEGTAALEEALGMMKEGPKAQKFGGGS